jgi:hypothetical protein
MPVTSDLQRIASVAILGLTFVLLAKLYLTGLTRRYRYFSCYLMYEAVCSLVLLLTKKGTTLYGSIWLISKPVLWVLCLMVLLEVYSLVLEKYPGIASLMRWTVTGAAIVSAAISIISLTLDFRNPNEPFPILRVAFAVQRTVDATMAISLVAPLLFMLQFPVRLSRNAVLHCLLFSALVGVEAGCLFARNWYGAESAPMFNLVMSMGTLLCRLGWIFWLTRKGEVSQRPVGPMCSPEMEQQLLDQLHAFNTVLLNKRRTQML